MKKLLISLLLLVLTTAVLFPFLSGIYAVFPEQALRRQERAYLVNDTEIRLKYPAKLYSMDSRPEYFFVTRDDGHHYLSHLEAKLNFRLPLVGHWVPAANMKTFPRGEVLSILPGWLIEFETTEAQKEQTGISIGNSLPIFVFDEQLQGDTIRGTFDVIYAADKPFHNLYGLALRFYAETQPDADGIGILSFNDHDYVLQNVTESMDLSDNGAMYAAWSILGDISDGAYTVDLHLTLLKDGEIIHTETVTLNP